jgi:RNA polymerase sigma factor (sigma-70 family)
MFHQPGALTMTVAQQPDVTDKFSTHLIRVTAKGLVSEGTFPPSDLEDVIQDLQLALIEQAGNFDPDKATWCTFVKTVIRSAAISLRRHRYAGRRSAPPDAVSLNALLQDADGQPAELGSLVSEEEYRTGRGQDFVSHTEQVELALDVQAVTDGLSDELREICELLKLHSVSEAARMMGMSRKKMLLRVEELRAHFRNAGLADVV